ncbi:hypothetical protein ASC80_06970 [Afipia sp. Root123D2]|uniref:VCBS domain-containing protein n=1 Tax=Afipia sp. Root123D2 TaxID=1736436 RepID=UPI0006FEF82F|nr:VCBS domain-containing protein [Afipia sp. Root123D2]KQW23053.1 hypothetical protein ASC80_06970 [Afipia sp. Root123D2]
MNFSGKFEHSLIGDALVTPDEGLFHFGHASGSGTYDGHSAVVTIPDAHLLFSGDMQRSGDDLILSGEGRNFTLHDYFKGEIRPVLASRDGASLSASIVEALTGHTVYAQAAGTSSGGQAIGQVMKLSGSASVIRNGVTVELNVGDAVLKGDVVQTGSGSSIGITFIDGSAFGMGANARMVLNEMIYDPSGSSNSSLISLVQGTITFVAGQTAKNGDMRVDTPVATMGIRGTAVLVEIAADDGPTKFSVLVEPDGHTGSYNLYNKTTGQLIGTISQAGQVTFVSASNNQITANEQPATPGDQQITKALVQQIFQLYFPNYTPDDATPKSNKSGSGSSGNNLADVHTPANSSPGSSTSILSIEVKTGSYDPVTGKIATVDKVYINSPALFNAAPAFAIQAFVVTTDSFKISDHVLINDPDIGSAPFFDVAVPFIPNSAKFVSVNSSIPLPEDFNPLTLVHVNQTTGKVTFDRHDFNFLNEGETLTYKLEFDSRSGPDKTHLTIPFIITGKNDAPVFEISDAPIVAAHAETDDQTGHQDPVTSDVTLPFHDPDFSDVGLGYSIQVMDVAATSGEVAGLPDHVTLMSFLTFGGIAKEFDSVTGQATGSFAAPDSIFDYLGAHDSVTLKYTIQLTDARGAIATQDVFVTVTGSNDTPVISVGESAQVATINELPGQTDDPTPDAACGGSIHFTDVDLTDTPTASVCGQSVCYIAADGQTVLTLTADQADAIKSAFSITPTAFSHDGTVVWSYSVPDNNLDFLAQDETVTLISTVRIDDHNGGTATATVTVNIYSGTNDVPTITSDVSAAQGGFSELADTTGNTTSLGEACGTLTFRDVDLNDAHIVTQCAPSFAWSGGVLTIAQIAALAAASAQTLTPHDSAGMGTGSVDWGYKIADNALDFLADGQTLTVTYDVRIDDQHNAVATQPIVVTITGTNDAPMVSASTPVHLVEATSADPGTASSVAALSLSDIDGTATYDTARLNVDGWINHPDGTFSKAGNYGTATLDTLSHTLTVALDNVAVDSLTAEDHHQVVFDIPVTDGSTPATTSVCFTIDGANDAPVLSANAFQAVDNGNGSTAFTGLSLFDADNGNSSLTLSANADHGTVLLASNEGTQSEINATLQNGFTYAVTEASPTETIAIIVTDDHGANDNFNFIFQQSAGNNGATLTGTAGNDAIFATNGSDNLTGNTGHDTFVFNDLAGTDVITDFHQGDDHIQLCATDVADFSALLAMTSDNTNGDAVIAVSAQDSITLLGVHKAALTANDFHIV